MIDILFRNVANICIVLQITKIHLTGLAFPSILHFFISQYYVNTFINIEISLLY